MSPRCGTTSQARARRRASSPTTGTSGSNPSGARPEPPTGLKILGFVVGSGIFLAVTGIAVVLFRERFPIDFAGVGLGGALFAGASGLAGIDGARLLWRSRLARRVAGGILLWWLAVAGYVWLAEPFAPYINFNDGFAIARWTVLPPLVALAVLGLRRIWTARTTHRS